MKTTPSVFVAGVLLCCGCMSLGRPPQADPGPGTILGAPSSPTLVTPRSDPQRVNRPPQPTQSVPADPDPPPRPPLPHQVPRDSGRALPDTEGPNSDAPRWQPLDAPPEQGDVPPSAFRDPIIRLGESAPFPAVVSRPWATEVSRTQSSSGDYPPSGVDVPPPLEWRADYESQGRRTIQSLESGSGEHAVLILGSLYGNEPESVALIDRLAQAPELLRREGFRFLLIRSPNPDGLAELTRTNQRGVDLNRNFPSAWFTSNPSQQTGPHPASEVETQAMLRMLRGSSPRRVVHVRSAPGSRPLILVNDAIRKLLTGTTLPAGIDFGTFEGSYKAGSLEEFVSLRMSKEMMTIFLPPDGFDTLSPAQLVEVSLLGLNSGLATSQPSAVSDSRDLPPQRQDVLPRDISGSEVPGGSGEGQGEKGPVELLPPPTDDFPIEGQTSSRYYELPPPPE